MITKINKQLCFFISAIVLIACQLKTKTELHLELGLDYLNNKIEIKECIKPNFCLEQMGFIKDNPKVIVLQIKDTFSLSLDSIRIKARIKTLKGENNIKWIELKNNLLTFEKKKYLISDFNFGENIINHLSLCFYTETNNEDLTLIKKLEFSNVRTNNQ